VDVYAVAGSTLRPGRDEKGKFRRELTEVRCGSRDLRTLAGGLLREVRATIYTTLGKVLGAKSLVKIFQNHERDDKKSNVGEMAERCTEKVRLSNGMFKVRSVE
jgi:hypothetical protein